MRSLRPIYGFWVIALVLAACTPIVVPVATSPTTSAPTATPEASLVPPGLPGVVASCGNVEVLSAELTAQEAQQLCGEALSERNKVEAFWGRTWPYAIRIHVSSAVSFPDAVSLNLSGFRGYIQMPVQVQTPSPVGRPSVLLSQMVYVYAPNDNRFLMDGLSGYSQEKLGGYLTADLHYLASSHLGELPSTGLTNLNAVRTPAPTWVVLRGNQRALTLAASFVRFLIEEYGLEAFRVCMTRRTTSGRTGSRWRSWSRSGGRW